MFRVLRPVLPLDIKPDGWLPAQSEVCLRSSSNRDHNVSPGSVSKHVTYKNHSE